MIKDLPLCEKVFFIHYQCEQFDVGRKIFSLSVLVNGKEIQFSLPDEAKNIKNFCDKVNELQREGLRPIHWNQTTHHYGETHIKNRYKELTSKSISLTYIEDINLSAWLKVCFGERYINHPRLDNLALLNKFNTIEQLEKDNRTFASVRLKLLSKIYFNIQRGTLITLKPQQLETKNLDEVKSNHPKHNPNLWSLECYNLFQYLWDNYYTSTKREITNIWFFLYEYDKIKYNLKATKGKYTDFICENYDIELKNFDKATHKFQQEYGTMNDHRINYEDTLLNKTQNT
jgi:hypothetical protein